MRKAYSDQRRLDCNAVPSVILNLNCRDEIVPVLAGLRHIYSVPQLRNRILDLVSQDVNKDSRSDCGREGLDYWHITVLAAVRLGCNLDYDKLQDLAEQHRAMRQVMGIGDWQDAQRKPRLAPGRPPGQHANRSCFPACPTVCPYAEFPKPKAPARPSL